MEFLASIQERVKNRGIREIRRKSEKRAVFVSVYFAYSAVKSARLRLAALGGMSILAMATAPAIVVVMMAVVVADGAVIGINVPVFHFTLYGATKRVPTETNRVAADRFCGTAR